MSLQLQHLAYLFLLVAGCGYAAVRGGAPERWGAGLTIGAVVASNAALAAAQLRYAAPEVGEMAVDLAYLAALVGLAAKANRFWPMLAAAVQVDEVLAHVMMFSAATGAFSYAFVLWLFSVPLPVIIGAGAWRHRQRLRTHGSDPSWNPER